MVLIAPNDQQIGFENVRLSIFPQDEGELGELMLVLGSVQHQTYMQDGSSKCINIPVSTVNVEETYAQNSNVRLVTRFEYGYWLKFPSITEAITFYQLLSQQVESVEYHHPDIWENERWIIQDIQRGHTLDPEGNPGPQCPCSCHYLDYEHLSTTSSFEEICFHT